MKISSKVKYILFVVVLISAAIVLINLFANLKNERDKENAIIAYNFLNNTSLFKDTEESQFYLFSLDFRKSYHNSRNLDIAYKYGGLYDGVERTIEYIVTVPMLEQRKIWTQHLDKVNIPRSFYKQVKKLSSKSQTFRHILFDYSRRITFKEIVLIKRDLRNLIITKWNINVED